MRLTEKSGKGVEIFGNKLAKMTRHISGTESAAINISTQVANDFIDCEVLALQLKDACLHDLVDSNPKALSVYEIIRTLNTKLQSLKTQGLWIPSEGKKLDTEGEMAGLNLYMNNLVE